MDSNAHRVQGGHRSECSVLGTEDQGNGGGWGKLERSSSCYCLGIGAQSCQGQCQETLDLENVCASQLKHIYGPQRACKWSVCHPLFPLLACFAEVNRCPNAVAYISSKIATKFI